MSDINAGFRAATAILAALHHRDTVSGRGQHIDLALRDSQVAAPSRIASYHLVSGRLPSRAGMASPIDVPWQAFDTAGRPLMATIGNARPFAAFCAALALPTSPPTRATGTTTAASSTAPPLCRASRPRCGRARPSIGDGRDDWRERGPPRRPPEGMTR